MEPKILLYDIETNGINGFYADLSFVSCFGYKWFGDTKTHCIKISDSPGFKQNPHDDSFVLKQAYKVMEEADLLVAHYGDHFDRKFIQGRLAINGLPPIPNTKQRDTCLIARRVFKFRSNRLANLAKLLNCTNHKQEKGEGWPLWWHQGMAGNLRAINKMAEYCKQDVRTLEDIYVKLRPFDTAHPNLNTVRNFIGACICGESTLIRRGFETLSTGRYQRYQCSTCGKWMRSTKAEVKINLK